MKTHPILNRLTKLRVAAELRKTHGIGWDESRDLADSLTDDVIDSAVHQTEGAVGAIGDGTLLQKLLDFFASPQGQALIALLIKILLGGI